MPWYESLLRPVLFSADPESIHELALQLVSQGAISEPPYRNPSLESTHFGLKFANPIGLAAGFDKNADALNQWANLGFGFAEMGTVTYRPQPGNPKPRLFRYPDEKAIVNRMGFNNHGAYGMAAAMAERTTRIPIGINLGKNKDTPLLEAPSDYQKAFRCLAEFGDYFVINVSSPNTPGLRDLQDKQLLADIVDAMHGVTRTKPIFIKIAPDLEFSDMEDVVSLAVEKKLQGIIATNTTISRPHSHHAWESGGLSGEPLRARAQEVMHFLGSKNSSLTLIGVGGIFSADDVWDRISAGAHLVQIYSGWVYGGPTMVPEICRNLAARLDQEGIANVAELVGSSHG